MPPRITQESYRPRVSDRTMVGNAATVTLASFRNRRAPSRPGKWNHRDGREPCPFARRRATVSLGQATRRRERPFKQWGWMPRPKYLRHRAKGEIFLLTSPFIGLADKGGEESIGQRPLRVSTSQVKAIQACGCALDLRLIFVMEGSEFAALFVRKKAQGRPCFTMAMPSGEPRGSA